MDIEYEGQSYSTVMIGTQCWMAENLNVGTKINATQNQADNSTIEKYCYDNNEANCDIYGGLYQWDEMMQYVTTMGTQGICPDGWHIPGDAEWKTLEGTVDSQYGVGDPEWDNTMYRGYDAGKNLKSTSGWTSDGNGTDLFGFTALPGGYRNTAGIFNYLEMYTYFWSSSLYASTYPIYRNIFFNRDNVMWNYEYKENGFSVRCIRGS
jgi:uncharacterized protein (TIGR02145 family)